ncbi:hypothetical protein [Flavivirga eckloniae]|uniref:TANFOR domain-containing protein n=1 Tax=Flavivirga eckloniae TaxID=1803846 RepID=A0A2K9PR51_9FLAO|nr:hypothetical protein [Flavivirga eckloniae]AUP79516.1 hypothetical protein C1H87_12685 [Flavivirga eckloniae]
MYILFKISKQNILTLLFVMINAAVTIAQDFPVTVSTNIVAPYGRDAFFYYDNTNVTIINPSINSDVSLYIEFKGDNGVDLRTRESHNPLDLVLQAGSPTILSSFELQDYFAPENLVATGISIAELQQNGLPAGQYQICVRVRNETGQFLSAEEPLGCGYFNIIAAEPPQLINPICGDEITTGSNNVIFSWTIPTGVSPVGVEYTFKMIELLPNQDPNQAFLASTVPAFFEQTFFTQNAFVYGPTNPPLETGKSYAWQVIARDGETNTPFINDGRSQVCWFKWNPATIRAIPILPVEEKPKLPTLTIDPQPMPISSLKGKLLYKFKDTSGSTNTTSTTGNGGFNLANVTVDPNPLINNNTTVSNKPLPPKMGYVVSATGAKPLVGVSVSLVVTHLFNGKDNNGDHKFQPVDDFQSGYLNSENKQAQDQVLATTITDGDGNFNFQGFINPYEDYGLVQSDIDAKQNSDVQNLWMKGDMYKVLRLKVNNQYYLSPDVNITINPFESKNIGEVVSLVKSYNLNVIPKWQADKKQTTNLGILSGVNISLTRGYTPNHVPKNEGNKAHSGSGILGDVVDNGITGANGITFKNLVRHSATNAKDRYTIVATESDKSLVTYKTKVKQYHVLVFAKDFPFTTQSALASSNFGQYLGENMTWNSELNVKTYTDTLWLAPNNPRIFGQVLLAENKEDNETRQLSNEKVHIIETNKNHSQAIKYYGFAKTDTNGSYEFDNLPVHEGGFNNGKREVVGPARLVYTNVEGFKGQLKKYDALKWGQQQKADFKLFADGKISGYVVDEEGNSISANVNVDSLAVKKTVFGFINLGNNGANNSNRFTAANRNYGQIFNFKAPSGKRKLSVKALSGNKIYQPKDTLITISKKGNDKPIKIVLLKKRKRIRFKVVEYNTKNAITNAKVTLEKGTGLETTKLTNNDGYVTFIFDSNVDDFTFSIAPPKGKEDSYTTESFVVRGVPNTVKIKTVLEHAYLEPTAKITGVVSIKTGDGIKPLKDAIVYFQEGNTQKQDTTDAQGRYNLKGIGKSIGNIELIAEKPGTLPMIKTGKKSVTIKSKNVVDFTLEYDKEVSMTTLFGFDFTIVSKERIDDNTFMITEGNIINIPENPNFKIATENDTEQKILSFSNLKIKKTGELDSHNTPIFAPETAVVNLNDKTLDVFINNAFKGALGDGSKQLQLKDNNGKGEIKGRVAINNVSFEFSEAYVNLENDKDITLTTSKGSTNTQVKVFAIDYTKKDVFGIVNKKDKELTFKLGEFEAKAKQDKSYITDNNVVFYTYLQTQKIEGVVPKTLKIEAGELTLQPKKLLPLNTSKALKFKLEAWDFESENWSFNTNDLNIEIPKATIKTGTIDVPVETVRIYSNDFDIDGSFKLDGLNIGGIADLNVVGSSTSFSMNPSAGSDKKPHWELMITNDGGPAASITLPGFETGKTLDFSSISLLSNGEQETSIDNNKPIKFYNIIDITPNGIISGDGFIDVSTSTNLGIPRVPQESGYIRFKKENGKVKATVSPIPFIIDAPGKVTLAIGNKPEDTEIRDGFFKAIGKLTDEEGINLKASIQKTNSDVHIEIEPGQTMQLGGSGTAFKDIKGRIDFDSKADDWTKLTFSGELDGFKGVTPGQRQTFTVHGDIKADSESIEVDNIETPFGDLALTYDIENSRFLGHLNINQSLGGMKFVGAADLLMGSGGWYFMAGGKGTPPGIGEVSVGLILGDSDYLAPDVTGNLMQFAYDKNVPPTIKNGVSGLFVTGQKVLPVINIPDWSIDLGVLNASLGAKAGLDARVWMDFDSSGDTFGIGAMAFAHVYFKANSITCTSLGAEARAELGIKGMYQTATGHFNLDGCGSIMVGGNIKQCVPTVFAGCKWCVSTGFSEAVKLDLHLDSGGNTDVSFGFGNCSGTPLSSGW